MLHRSTREACLDLQRHGRLVRVDDPVDAVLEVAEIQRRVHASGGPAILFTNVTGCRFPLAANLFGTLDRARFLFRHTIEAVRRAIELRIEPEQLAKRPWRYLSAPTTALRMRPRSVRSGAVEQTTVRLSELPRLVSWPDDGGPFVTLPQVFSESPARRGLTHSNLGMYRVQISGNDYAPDREVGLHYQIHRGIGVHHREALDAGVPLPVTITVGGTPAMTLAAVMPLPEGMSELGFAGALAGRRIPMIVSRTDLPGFPGLTPAAVYADADFAISGVIDPTRMKPEGPFGDHLGYYSLVHPFPFVTVTKVTARKDAVWPLTVVGRPPQEDTTFGELIHELTGPIIPTVIPGIKAVNAVDAAGVHPLLLAIGSERYHPYRPLTEPAELLTQASAILGQGQMSLAKYLLILNDRDVPDLDLHDIESFLLAMLRRIDWRRDLHFLTRTTIDTLDYSGRGFNQGSKVIFAAVGPPVRTLPTEVPSSMRLPRGWTNAKLAMPGVLCVEGPAWTAAARDDGPMMIRSTGDRVGDEASAHPPTDIEPSVAQFCQEAVGLETLRTFPLIVLTDDATFAAATINNFLWTTFTRSDPAADVWGVGGRTWQKHFGCEGPLVIDARRKTHHAPPLIENPAVTKAVDARAARGGPLAPYL